MKKTRLILVRHGRVENHATNRINGHIDVGIDELGVKQMHAVSARLEDEAIDYVYCSDLSRCVRGAAIISQDRCLAYLKDNNFRELNMGSWDGLTYQEIQDNYPDELANRLADLVNFRIPGGESLLDLQNRVMPKLHHLLDIHKYQTILLLAHAGVNRIILCQALGLDLCQVFRLGQDYGCINIIDYYDDDTVVFKLNA
ncbi:MAG: alpha-ribazole phosphatase [Deltaproteobacteria bacterium]|nr:alpha-ribazole phosphatase [Deltaproteobacteria bacterium]